ncbi:hypothetical protein NLJ89_g11545 [Agrocybe chaxingu]|uniref:Uncharacterized protein n=1 Tax=Agrocybe chaxingu TaxID=84603 RepID=A0A9W8MRJ0_9AGAR|nr:hypothetical protein NLJ89_g11545 [Agrocybe chaxingu]
MPPIPPFQKSSRAFWASSIPLLISSAAVEVKADIKVEVVVDLLHEVAFILNDALINVQYIVEHPTDFALTLSDTILSTKEVSFVVGTVIHLLFTVLGLVYAAVGVAAHGVVGPAIAEIGGLVAKLLTVVLALVPGLLALLIPTIISVIPIVYHLSLANVVAVLGLPPLF